LAAIIIRGATVAKKQIATIICDDHIAMVKLLFAFFAGAESSFSLSMSVRNRTARINTDEQ
jgi:hypothetical protein